MPITYLAEKRCFKLDTAKSTYLIQILEQDYLLHAYYGARLPDAGLVLTPGGADYASFSPDNPHLVGRKCSPDTALMEYSGFGTGDYRPSAIRIRNANGDNATDLRYQSHTITPGKPKLPGMPSLYADDSQAQTLAITASDPCTGAEVTLYYTVFEQHSAMTRFVTVKNTSDKPMEIEKVSSLSLSLPTMDYDFVRLYGSWYAERNVERTPLHHGTQSIGSTRGSSSHHYNPFAAIVSHDATEETGEAYGINLVYSGNFLIEADVDFYGSVRLNAGIHPDGFTWHLTPGETFTSPEAVMVYSNAGVGEMSRTFHRLYNHHLIRGKWQYAKRPLLINSWEAAYFDFDTEKLVAFAQEAKKLGVNMLVMDDGWFGKRNDDTCSLGDWTVNEDKLPGGLGELIRRVNAEGLKFGIWYEPEMISPDSDLYRAHPDWCLHIDGREKSIARQQYVLDMSRKEVRDCIFDQMYAVLSKYPIDYVKWDFNRNLTEVASASVPQERQKEIFHRFVLGTYELMDRITTAFPDILLENCSGGGGRFDPGMLAYSPQIWCSDNTDAIQRLSIQFGTSYCYPAGVMGAHVSFNPRTGFATKGNVALWGTFGYELDPTRLTDDDRALIAEQVTEYHKYYDLIHFGDLYRLIAPDERHSAVRRECAWEFVSEDKKEALLTFVTIAWDQNNVRVLRLRGLDPEMLYREESTGQLYSGAALMYMGINLSTMPHSDGSSFKLYFKATPVEGLRGR